MASRFSDIQSHWARSFIEALADRGIVRGFEDRTFRPNQAVRRSEFAALVQTAFPRPPRRTAIAFTDVPTNHWAATAIRRAYETGFLSGFPNRQFRPDEPITRTQMWVSLVGGLEMGTSGEAPLAELFQDAGQIPAWARGAVAVAAETSIILNQPNLRLLRSEQPATRGDMAACIYQCLLHLGQATPIQSEFIVRWVRQVQVSHRREFRAVWVASVWNGDFPSATGLSTAQQQAELVAILDRMQAMNLNALILQVRPEGDALYASQLEPWSNWLTGVQGKAPDPFYDPLEFAIAQCHQRNIELHAWFNPYRARTSRQTVNVRPHIAVTNPDVVYEWGNQLWMDPGAAVVQDRTYNVIMDVVRRYNVDGIHLDDYFYPYPIAGWTFPDDKTYQAYRSRGGALSLGDWRRDNVNQMVQRLASGIRAIKPHVKFGVSPFGIYRPGQPPQIQGLDAYDQLYADSLKWLQQGWVDYFSPQLYWRIDPPAQSYPVLLQWWADNNTRQRHLYAGNNIGQLDGRAWDLTEIERQIGITRQLSGQQVFGNIFFSMRSLTANRQGIADQFQNATYQAPALVPVMSWLQQTPPPSPPSVRLRDGKLTWTAPSANTRAWTLYCQTGTTWTLQRILPASITAIALEPGRYALCAVDRLASESPGVVVTV
jgi:uncharacterized lipoprotein YddW (UPF0748 family)